MVKRLRLMTQKGLMRAMDQERIQQAIRYAERQTSGEIRVSVSPFFWGDVRQVAEQAFVRLGMTGTKQANGILFFIVPSRRRFVVLGDAGIHAKVGQEFWERVALGLSERFQQGDFTGGLVQGIGIAGEQLAQHFPFDPAGDVNELDDAVDFGPTGKR